MTDIIKFNDTHTPKTAIGMKKFELAEALTAISDLQNPYRLTELSKEQRYKLYNKSMRKVCDILDIDLDMHEMMKTGSEGFSYSDSAESTEELKYILDNKVVYSREIENEDQPQNTVKSIVKTLQNISLCPWEHAEEDIDVLGDLVYSYVSDLCNALGFEDMSDNEASIDRNEEQQQSVKDILLALHEDLTNEDLNPVSLRDFGRIHVYDLADLLGIGELSSIRDIHIVEGEQWLKETAEKLADQEIYDSLPAEDKLNVDMLNKLREVRDHLLSSGQNSVSMNRVFTATSILEGGLGVIDHEEE